MSNIPPPIISTTELSLEFDKMFNNLYDTQNILNKKINTNESLIRQNMLDYQTQEVQNNSLRIISKSITNNCTLSPKVNNSVCQCYGTLFFINYIVAIS